MVQNKWGEFVKYNSFPLFNDERLQQYNTNLKKSNIGLNTEKEYNDLKEWVDNVYMTLDQLDKYIKDDSNALLFLPYYNTRNVRHHHIPFDNIVQQIKRSGNLKSVDTFDYETYKNTIPYVRSDIKFLKNVFSKLRKNKLVSRALEQSVKKHPKPLFNVKKINVSVPLQQQKQQKQQFVEEQQQQKQQFVENKMPKRDFQQSQRFYRSVNPEQYIIPPQYSSRYSGTSSKRTRLSRKPTEIVQV